MAHAAVVDSGDQDMDNAFRSMEPEGCGVDPQELESLNEDRSPWHALCKASVQQFECD